MFLTIRQTFGKAFCKTRPSFTSSSKFRDFDGNTVESALKARNNCALLMVRYNGYVYAWYEREGKRSGFPREQKLIVASTRSANERITAG